MSNVLMWDCFDMPHIPLQDAASLPAAPGVYVVYQEEHVSYVGETKNLGVRWKAHHQYRRFYALGPALRLAWHVMPGSTASSRRIYEQALITFLKPSMQDKQPQHAADPASARTSALQHHRKAAGLTMAELAQKTGIAHSTIWKIEHGQRKLHIHEVKPLAMVLGCQPEALLPDIPTEEPARV